MIVVLTKSIIHIMNEGNLCICGPMFNDSDSTRSIAVQEEGRGRQGSVACHDRACNV